MTNIDMLFIEAIMLFVNKNLQPDKMASSYTGVLLDRFFI